MSTRRQHRQEPCLHCSIDGGTSKGTHQDSVASFLKLKEGMQVARVKMTRLIVHAYLSKVPSSIVTLLICTGHVQVKDALEMYEGIVEHPFKLIHCWYMLRNEMKWNTYLQSVSAASAVPQDNPPAAVLDDTLPTRIERPMGRDKAKKQRSGTSSSSSFSSLHTGYV